MAQPGRAIVPTAPGCTRNGGDRPLNPGRPPARGDGREVGRGSASGGVGRPLAAQLISIMTLSLLYTKVALFRAHHSW
jgi:hypothetical protein